MSATPWYTNTLRWAQTNLVEIDPERYDAAFWREHWRKTRIQGVIVNAGGIVAYYPSKFPLHHRAERLGDRDLYGEIVAAAREEGLSVVARMDSNRVAQAFYEEHPDWVCRDINGEPYRLKDKYVTCIGSPYYTDYLPRVMEEIIGRSHPDAFADNSWAGLPRSSICYCEHCQTQFKAHAGADLPRAHDWDDVTYRQWVTWSYGRRTALWEANNAVTRAAGGENCYWLGMIHGDMPYNSERFVDLPAILKRTPIAMLDHQRRSPADGFEQNTEVGRRLHELLGWDGLIPESTPQYQLGGPIFRLAAMPQAEVRLWATSGFAGGIQPWWHHIGSSHDDRRQYLTAEPLFRWHEANQDVLFNRQPIADVAVIWSQQNHDFHGRDRMVALTLNPYRGVVKALDRLAIPFLPIHADKIAEATKRFKVIVLPELGVLSDAQVKAIAAFAEAGGTVVATGTVGAMDEKGNRRAKAPLSKLFGVELTGDELGGRGPIDPDIEKHERHTYLRLTPELRAAAYGPADATAPAPQGNRHPILAGFDQTDILPFGGHLPIARVAGDTTVLATFIPDFPIFPPETAWMREPRSNIPAITVRETANGGKLVWFLADLDRCFARDQQLEHAQLIANAVVWGTGPASCIELSGTHGLVTATPYQQENRTVVHLNNRFTSSLISGRQTDLVPIGPIEVTLPVPAGKSAPANAVLRVAGGNVGTNPASDRRASWTVPSVADHEILVIDWL